MDHFADRLARSIRRCRTPVLVGLDPRAESLPDALRVLPTGKNWVDVADSYRRFCCEIIDAVAGLVAIVKPQAAFFEQLGPAGMSALADVIRHAHKRGLLVVLDGKRNDIGSTATAYAEAYLGAGEASPWGADALTVSPYLGDDSLDPFVEVGRLRGAGLFVLVKTSNPGSRCFQDLVADGQPIYRHVAGHVERMAADSRGECGYGSVGAVVGATHPEQLAELRAAMPQTWFLVPGFGAQGGTAQDVAQAFDSRGLGAIVNNSRGINFAYNRSPYRERYAADQWQRAVEDATHDMIELLRAETPAGNLSSAGSD